MKILDRQSRSQIFVKNHTLARLDKLFAAAIGQRLTYKELIA